MKGFRVIKKLPLMFVTVLALISFSCSSLIEDLDRDDSKKTETIKQIGNPSVICIKAVSKKDGSEIEAVERGTDFLLKAEAKPGENDTADKLKYIWYEADSEEDDDFSKKSIGEGIEFLIKTEELSCGAHYYFCEVRTSSDSSKYKFSTKIKVIVNEKPEVINAYPVQIKPDSTDITVTSGENYTLGIQYIISEGSGKGTISVQWFEASSETDTEGNLISEAIEKTYSSSYSLNNETEKVFYYFCKVTNTLADNGDGGNKVSSEVSSIIKVTVNNKINANKPVIEAAFENVEAVVDNIKDSYEINITASVGSGNGAGTLSYQWYVRDSNDKENLISNETSNKLTVLKSGISKVGEYFFYCNVNNSISDNGDGGNKTACIKAGPYVIKIVDKTEAKQPQINSQPKGESLSENEDKDVVLTVQAVSNDGGSLSYQWYKEEKNNSDVPISGETNNSYTVKTSELDKKIEHFYYCEVKNSIDDHGVKRTSKIKTSSAKIYWAAAKYSKAATDFSAPLGSSISDEKTSFVLYSKNAEKVLLEIYNVAYGEDALYEYWMEKDSSDYWRITLNGNLAGAIYAFRLWGPNWTYSDKWQRGGSSEGFISDCDSNGNRFNPNKVVFDPYAKEITHDKSNPVVLNGKTAAIYTSGDANRNFDTAFYAPKAYVIDDSSDFGTKPGIPSAEARVYEAHVRGLTKHESSSSLTSILNGIEGFDGVKDVPPEYRGTYKGAGYMAKYLKGLGINTIEFLPVHESDNDCNPDDKAGGNYWAYMTYGYFAPDRRYSYDKTPGGPTKEFKEMVKAFHDEGIEVYLDVVYNHTGEGGPWQGKTDNNKQCEITFMRGIDNATYYSLNAGGATYWETSGCGNNMRCDNPVVRKLIIDSLSYWITDMGVDGFRFDLAPVLGRVEKSSNDWNTFDKNAATLTEIGSLGKAHNVEMIAEAWDCGWPSGYQVGNFPDGWGDWNGIYRDVIRKFVGGSGCNETKSGGVDYRLDATDAIWGHNGNGGTSSASSTAKFGVSVNMIVAHDGFTLADLSSYSGAGNARNGTLAWPFGPSDGGNGDQNSLPGTSAEDCRRTARNYIALQMFTRGIPMIVLGDEFCRTQNGNNNAYNLDSYAIWNNYNMISTKSPQTVSTGGTGSFDNKFGTFNNSKNRNGNFIFMQRMLKMHSDPAFAQLTTTGAPTVWVEGGSNTDRFFGFTTDGTGVGGHKFVMFTNQSAATKSLPLEAPKSGYQWVKICDTNSSAEQYENSWDPFDESAAGFEKITAAKTISISPYTTLIYEQVKAGDEKPSCSTPVISGTSPFDTSTQITIECDTDGAKIYYTVDGTSPSEESGTLYTGAFTVTERTTVKAIAVLDGYKTSSVASKTFYVKGQVSESSKTGVMLQGFTWNSAPRGTSWNKENPSPYWGKWYGIMKNNASAIKDTFEYVWFNPPSICDSASSEGYAPTELNNLNSYYGTEAELKEVIQAIKPAKAIADIVVNHRAGSTSWGDFTNPSWCEDYYAICSDDEGFSNSSSPMYGSSKKGSADTGDGYGAYRDLDHTNTNVQDGIIAWMNDVLKPAGFVGWRYDYVKGFAGKYVGKYNAGSNTQFSVGEYWPTAGYDASSPSAWGNEIKNWIASTEEESGQRSRAFDFALKGAMNSVFGWGTTAGSGNYALLADSSNLYISQPSDAVTFIDNHDTGSNQGHWELNRDKIGAGYALILTHPGVPCVSWSHYFTFSEGGNGETTYPYSGLSASQSYIAGNTVSGTDKTLREHIDYLIQLRKEIGIEYDSLRTTLKAESSVYAAEITGTNGSLIVSIGGSYTPTGTGYDGNKPIYGGTNFRIWQKGVNGTYEQGEETTVELSVTVDDWAWSNSVEIFAWVWTNGLSNGSWVQCSGSGTTVKLELPSGCDRFLLVRCPAGTTQPDWDATGDTPGKVYNKTPDISYVNGTTSYSANFGNP